MLNVGAVYLGDARCRFTVWAPLLKQVAVHIVSPTPQLVPMQRDQQGYWTAIASNVEPGAYYFYQLNGELDRPDPASLFQPEGVHGPSQVVNHQAFTWTDLDWRGVPLAEMIIYELHIGTFTPEGTFEAVIPRLPRLKELGITAIEVMPICQFPGDRNWGYDGVFPYAVQNSYGGVDGFKRLVDACHAQGMAVILDVVYNHLGPEGNYLNDFAPYFTEKYHGVWGNAFNLDDAHCDGAREFFLDNALYWLHTFHVDALRLDAVQGIYDLSAHHFLEELADRVAESSQNGRLLYLTAESDLNDVRLIRPKSQGGYGIDAQWCDDFHHALHTLITGERHAYYQDFGRCEDLAKSLREGFVYSGQYAPHRFRRHGNSSAAESACRFIVSSQNHDQTGNRLLGERLSQLTSLEGLKLTAAMVLLSPYIPLLFMGEEYGETNPFFYFISHSDPDLIKLIQQSKADEFKRVGFQGESYDPQSPETMQRCRLNWEQQNSGESKILWNFYQRLIQLRRSHPVFKQLNNKQLEVMVDEDQKLLQIHRWHETNHVYSVMNFGDRPATLTPQLPQPTLKKLLDSASPTWGGTNTALPESLTAGQSISIAPKSIAIWESQTD